MLRLSSILMLLLMLRARSLLGFITPAGLRMIGRVLAVRQASLGTQ